MQVRMVLVLLLILISFSHNLKAQPLKNVKPIDQVMTRLGCSQEDAEQFLAYVSKQVTQLQIFLSIITSTEYSLKRKNEVINFLLEEVFTENAFVTVSSKENPEKQESLRIKEYLEHLTNLSNKYGYDSAKLYYNPRFLVINGFEALSGVNQFEMSIAVKQYFQGKNEKTGLTYRDETQKNFICEIKELTDGKLRLRWKGIQADRTIRISEEKIQEMLVEFEQFKTDFLGNLKRRLKQK